jgi:hypothetical protein
VRACRPQGTGGPLGGACFSRHSCALRSPA